MIQRSPTMEVHIKNESSNRSTCTTKLKKAHIYSLFQWQLIRKCRFTARP